MKEESKAAVKLMYKLQYTLALKKRKKHKQDLKTKAKAQAGSLHLRLLMA